MTEGITEEVAINRKTAEIMIFFGLADAIAGYLFGKVSNIFGKRKGMLATTFVGILAIVTTYVTNYYVMKCFTT